MTIYPMDPPIEFYGKVKRALYWFTYDLRIDDNNALSLATQCEELFCLYCVNPRLFKPQYYQLASMGRLRWQFLQQNLNALSETLKTLKQTLCLIYQEPEQGIVDYCQRHDIQRLIVSRQIGFDERHVLSIIQQVLPDLEIIEIDTYSLLQASQAEPMLSSIEQGFDAFKQSSLKLLTDVKPLNKTPDVLPPSGFTADNVQKEPSWLPTHLDVPLLFNGGEVAARQQLRHYFASQNPGQYRHTRQSLTGFVNTSKLSPWLNIGALSVRQVYQAILRYEKKFGVNLSTASLRLELLKREYFHWLALAKGKKLFSFKGFSPQPPLTGYYAERFQKWCQGNTPYPIVNACMQELRQTGYISHRARQIAASCLVNELAHDWRYGAAWFERHLLDYHVGSNWCNWQSVAGVSVDQKGVKPLNLDEQHRRYDPENTYIHQWLGTQAPVIHQLDSVDAADWPLQ